MIDTLKLPVTHKEFLRDVRKEIKHIKTHATRAEKSKLNFKKFDCLLQTKCIYGLMTGHCESVRSVELMPKVYQTEGRYHYEHGNAYTPLEVYLFHTDADAHQHIIDFIRNKTEKLKIK